MSSELAPSVRKLKVAIVAPSLRYVGGQAVQADLLLRMWRDDPEVQVHLIPVDPQFPSWLAWADRIPVLRTILREPIYCVNLWRGLRDADIAHIFAASYWSFLLAPTPAWFIAKVRRKKVIVNYRSGEARDHLQRFRSGRFVLACADEIVTPSHYLGDVFREFGLKSVVIPNVVDPLQFGFRERKPLKPKLVCTRGFSGYYSVDVAVRAFAEVQRHYPDAQLDLPGQGPLESEIRSLVSTLGIAGVTFSGVASRIQIGQHYDSADIFINASWLDNSPVSIIEAFRSGTPVVSTSPESMSYLVEHERTGLLSKVGDHQALAANVMRLLQSPDLAARLAENAYQESQKFSWPAVREKWLETYRRLSQREFVQKNGRAS